MGNTKMLHLLKNLITHHFRQIIVIVFGLFIIMMSIAFYFTSDLQSHHALENEANEAILKSAQQSATNIEIHMEGRSLLLETIANRTILRGKFGDRDASMEEKLETLKSEQQRLMKLGFKRLGILDTKGVAYYTSGRKLYLGDRDYFIKALNGKNSISGIFVSKYDKEPIYVYTTPIKDITNEKIIGALFGTCDAWKLSEIISSISYAKSGYAFIIDKEGTIIAHKDFSKVFYGTNLLSTANDNLVQIASHMVKGESGKGLFTDNKQQWNIAYAPIKTTEWSIGIAVPSDEIYERSTHLKNSLFVAFSIVLIIALIIAYSMADIISRYQRKLEVDKKEKDTDLLITKNKYETTLSALPDLMFELGLDGTYYDYHSPYTDLLAVPPHKLIGQTVQEVLPKMASNICLNALAEANDIGFSRGKIIEIPLHKGQTWFELSIAKKPMQPDDDQPRFIVLSRDITDRKKAEEKNYYLANFDYLTGLANRTQLDHHFKYILSLAKRNQIPFAIMFLDLDHFKEINDTLGHHIGDKMLIESAHRLKFLKRETDVVARLGGDEFIILLPNTSFQGASDIAEKILSLISKPYTISSHTLNITVSIGIALYPQDGDEVEILSQKADVAMYRSKETGRNNFKFFT